MSTTKSPAAQRFKIPHADPEGIADEVDRLLDDGHAAILDEADGWRWSLKTVALADITQESDLIPQQNAALQERSRAVARAKLTVGEAPPLVVITEDNVLLDGHSRLAYLEELGETHAVVYHGTPE